jgi:tetratricopeptide (TPR) repeat protein
MNPAWASLAAAAVLLIAVGLVYLRVHSAPNTTATNTPQNSTPLPALAAPAVTTAQSSPATSSVIQNPEPATQTVKLSYRSLADLVLPVYPMHMLRGDAVDAQFTKGMAAYQNGNCSKTVVALNDVSESAPEYRAARFYAGACLMHLGKLDAALASLSKVADAGDTPEQEPALYEMAQVALAQNNPTLAHKYLQQTIALRGDLEAKARAEDARLLPHINSVHP